MKAISKLFLVIFAAITCFGCEKIENDNNEQNGDQNTQEDFYYVRFDVDCQYGYSYARISLTGCNSFTINGGIGSSNSEILGPASKGAVAKIEVVGGSGSTAIYVSKNNGPFALRRQGGSSLSYTIDF